MTFKRTFCYLFCLSLLLFCLLLLNTATFISSSLSHARFSLPWMTYQQLALCILSHLFLLMLFSSYLTLSTRGIVQMYQDSDPFMLMLFIWTIATLALFAANQVFYPQSQYAILSSSLINNTLARLAFFLITIILSGLCLLGIRCYIKPKYIISGLFCLMALTGFGYLHKTSPPSKQYSQPDIILLGVDSLRLEALQHAPHLKQLLTHTTQFTQAETPLARTFPAWVSILTGLYPIHHGARYNLTNSKEIKTTSSLAWDLKKAGYQTVYGSDEKRFSLIDEAFGFDTLIGPKTGANDFIQSQLNDMPLSNLIINTRLGKWLFPYNYANRASFVHYYPKTFTHEIEKSLNSLSPEKPLLLSMHLTLTHWPLLWGETSQSALHHQTTLYANALSALDKQLASIIQHLNTHHRLSHAILILLSDHGDAVFEPHSRLTDRTHYHGNAYSPFMTLLNTQGKILDQSFGHGTDLLSPKQTHILLAFKCYGEIQCPNKRINTPVSLIDIKPTLYTLLNLPNEKTDGVSLYPLFIGNTIADRVLLSETGFDPDQQLGMTLKTDKKKINTAISLAKQFYRVNEDEHIILKNETIKRLLKQKQVAARTKHWILALYPHETFTVPVLLNTTTLAWTDDLNSALAKKAPITRLKQAIKQAFPSKAIN